jgi:hypothetical protein
MLRPDSKAVRSASRLSSLDDLATEVPFAVFIRRPPLSERAHIRLDPGDLATDNPSTATVAYVVMEGNRQRGNVWVTLSEFDAAVDALPATGVSM